MLFVFLFFFFLVFLKLWKNKTQKNATASFPQDSFLKANQKIIEVY